MPPLQRVKYCDRPATLDDGASVMLDGILVKRTGDVGTANDGKWLIRNVKENGYLEVRGDGTYGYNPDPNSYRAGATLVAFNILEFPAESDRQDGWLHPTFPVVFTHENIDEP